MSAPTGKASSFDIKRIQEYYDKKIDVFQHLTDDKPPTQELNSLKLDDKKEPPKTEQPTQQ
jgi:hypothetical protein